MGIVCPREPFAPRGRTIQRPRGHPQPPTAPHLCRNARTKGSKCPRTDDIGWTLLNSRAGHRFAIIAARSKSLAQMNKTRYRPGVETSKNKSELMRMLAVAKCRLMGYPAVRILARLACPSRAFLLCRPVMTLSPPDVLYYA